MMTRTKLMTMKMMKDEDKDDGSKILVPNVAPEQDDEDHDKDEDDDHDDSDKDEDEDEGGSNILVPNVAPEQDWQPATNFVTTPLFSNFYSPHLSFTLFQIFLQFSPIFIPQVSFLIIMIMTMIKHNLMTKTLTKSRCLNVQCANVQCAIVQCAMCIPVSSVVFLCFYVSGFSSLSGYSALSCCSALSGCSAFVWVLGNFDCLARQWPASHASSNSATHKISWGGICK